MTETATERPEIVLRLSSRGFPAHAKESDYDHWIGYVVQHLEREPGGLAVDVTEASAFGDGSPPFASVSGGTDGRAILEAVQRLWDRFVAEHMPPCDPAFWTKVTEAPAEPSGDEP